ncbi:unnamed protein product [Echinostoma caproni]|uniref:Uncharacterized protein n=1 Tax=Echinostoma caproni TaxID=27848 RepID=A0A183A0R6_9TREM|nr:unnamed protein product [Echinostoma caproni]
MSRLGLPQKLFFLLIWILATVQLVIHGRHTGQTEFNGDPSIDGIDRIPRLFNYHMEKLARRPPPPPPPPPQPQIQQAGQQQQHSSVNIPKIGKKTPLLKQEYVPQSNLESDDELNRLLPESAPMSTLGPNEQQSTLGPLGQARESETVLDNEMDYLNPFIDSHKYRGKKGELFDESHEFPGAGGGRFIVCLGPMV